MTSNYLAFELNVLIFRFVFPLDTMGAGGSALGRSTKSVSTDEQMFCNLCTDVQASAWCANCKFYLCVMCERHHKIISTTRDHIILSCAHMPSIFPSGNGRSTENNSIQKCHTHPQEEIKFFCPNHDSIGCVICLTLEHATCDKQYIPDISEEFKSSKYYKNLLAEFQGIDKRTSKSIQEIDSCLEEVDMLSTREINKLQHLKALIIKYLDQREKKLLIEIKTMRDQDTTTLVNLQETAKILHSDLDKTREKLKSCESNTSNLFVAAKRAQTMLNQLQTGGYKTQNTIPTIHNQQGRTGG